MKDELGRLCDFLVDSMQQNIDASRLPITELEDLQRIQMHHICSDALNRLIPLFREVCK